MIVKSSVHRADDKAGERGPKRPRRRGERSAEESESPRRRSGGEGGNGRREVAPEFRDIPSWEEAIASLAIKSPGADHAVRSSSRRRGSRRRRS